MQRFKITRDGYKKIQDKLNILINIERPAISKSIGEAIELGDLSENTEYTAAKEKQRVVETMISNLSEQLSQAEIVDISKLSGNLVDFGAIVYMVDEDTNKNVSYKLLSEYEADLSIGIISIESPIGRALLGKKKGDSVEIKIPSGTKFYEILDIKWGE